MSYFVCGNCDTKHEVFGKGSLQKLVEQFGFKNAFSLPIDGEISRLSDQGTPIVLERQNSPVTKQFNAITDALVREISKLVHGQSKTPEVSYDSDRGILFTSSVGETFTVSPATLRRACRCAHCINELTGEQVLQPENVSEDIKPEAISPLGNYAVTISWTDGHSSIFPYDMLAQEMNSNIAG